MQRSVGHFVVPPGPKGEKPYHPHALFGVLAWGCLHGVRSSRKLARLARRTTARWRASAGTTPPRSRPPSKETVVLALRLGLARLGHVALGGTRVRASTSKHKAMSYGRMRQREAQLTEEIARLVERAARLAKIRALRQRLEVEERAAQGLDPDAAPAVDAAEQRSFTDADARIMLTKLAIYCLSATLAYAHAAREVFRTLRETGQTRACEPRILSRQEYEAVLGLDPAEQSAESPLPT